LTINLISERFLNLDQRKRFQYKILVMTIKKKPMN